MPSTSLVLSRPHSTTATGSSRNNNANNNINNNCFDDLTKAELLALIQLYLAADPKYHDVAVKLQECIDTNQVLPPRYDVEGRPHSQTLEAFLDKVRPFASSMPKMFERLCQLQTKVSTPPVRGLPIRFFSSRRTALDRGANEKFYGPPKIQSVICQHPSTEAITTLHPIKFLQARELGRTMPLAPKFLFRKENLSLLNRHARILGHLSSIFCVAFDRTGRYIFTGADDNLIKVWDAQRCLLRFTFRGHNGEITDMSVSHENTLLASASVDKTVRIWCLRKGSTLRVYKGHTATVNSILFIPSVSTTDSDEWRWLVSAGNDCSVVFHRYNETTKHFIDPPTKFNERATGGARIVSSSHSPGGSLVIMGDTHQAIIMYKLSDEGVERLYELSAHSDRIDTLIWAHRSLRFASGSKDGTAKAWSLRGGKWRSVELTLPPENNAVHGDRSTQPGTLLKKNSANAYKVTMLTWTMDDDLIVSIGSDYLLRTWNWTTGQMLGKFAGHQNDTFILFAHPVHRELVVSAGHDGLFIIWNIYNGRQLCRHRNENTNHETVAIFDMAIAPDGTTVGCVDAMGSLSIYGVANSQQAMTRPHEQFFSTDYRLVQMDANGMVTDDDTGLPPETLSPPFFVTSDGNFHPESVQKLVPGNDIKSDDVIKPCAWLKRDIVPPMRDSELNKYRREQIEHNRLEVQEYERRTLVPEDLDEDDKPVVIDHIIKKGRRQRRSAASTAAATRRSDIRALAEYLLQNQPRYVLDDQYTDDENDLSFSLGSAEEEEEEEHDEHAEIRSASSSLDDGDSDESSKVGGNGAGTGGAVDEEDDENDSDYEVGRTGQDTVFRARSTWTVTGKRKRRQAALAITPEQEENSSQAEESHFYSERLRARAAASRAAALDQQPTSTARLAAQQNILPCRTIRTRRSAFIPSSEDGDQGSREREVKLEPEMDKLDVKQVKKVEEPRKRGRKKTIKIEPEDGEEEEEAEELGDVKPEVELNEKPIKKKRPGRGRKKRINAADGSEHRLTRMQSKSNERLRRISRMDSSTPANRERGFATPMKRQSQVDFPAWMRTTNRRRFPFIPQIGDLVVYFLQGHRTYLEELENVGFRVPSKLKIETFLDAQEVCYIDEISYITIAGKCGVTQVAELRLARTKNGKRNGTGFYICYHDMKDVIDFLVLKQHFDSSMEMRLGQGDRVEGIIDDKFYTGIVIKKDPYESDYPNSEWSTISIRWDNGEETDRLNPWDLQKLKPGRKSEIPAKPADLATLGDYRPIPDEWAVPAHVLEDRPATVAEELYLHRVLGAIDQLSQLRSVLPFREPVDLQRYTNYIGAVNYPIDLRTIEERIHNKFYRRSLSLLHDVQYIAKNAIAFNHSESPIVRTACALVETIFVFMQDWNDAASPVALFHCFEVADKLHCYQQKLRPAESITARQQAMLGRTRSSGGASSSSEQQCCSSSLLPTGGGNALMASGGSSGSQKEPKVPLWAEECREMVKAMTDAFWERANNRDANEFAFSFLGNLRSIVEPIGQYKEPGQFVERLRKFLSEQKNIVVEQESRRSKTFLGILQMESLLESKQQPILAKFRRMVAADKSPSTCLSSNGRRQQRKAAVSARKLFRNIDADYEEEEDEEEQMPTTIVAGRHHHQQQQGRRNAAARGIAVDHRGGIMLRQRSTRRAEQIKLEPKEELEEEEQRGTEIGETQLLLSDDADSKRKQYYSSSQQQRQMAANQEQQKEQQQLRVRKRKHPESANQNQLQQHHHRPSASSAERSHGVLEEEEEYSSSGNDAGLTTEEESSEDDFEEEEDEKEEEWEPKRSAAKRARASRND